MLVPPQTVRYGLAKGKAEAVLQVSRQQRRWIGATAPRSPIRTSAGGHKRGETCPVLLSAVGRVVTAVDAGTGDEAVLVRGTGPVCSVAVGDNGELVRGRTIAMFSCGAQVICLGWLEGWRVWWRLARVAVTFLFLLGVCVFFFC